MEHTQVKQRVRVDSPLFGADEIVFTNVERNLVLCESP